MALIETFDTPEGVEFVREVEHEQADSEAERLRLFRTAPKEVQVGEVLGEPVYTNAEYFLVIDVDYVETIEEEMAEMMTMMGQPTEAGDTHHDLAVIVTSNEDGDIGTGVQEIEGGTTQDAIDVLESL